MKIIDKATWQIDGGMATDLVVAHFKKIFIWLDKNDMLTNEGKEALEDGIDESISLHERLLTPYAMKFLEAEYDNYISVNCYGTDEDASVLDKLYLTYQKK